MNILLVNNDAVVTKLVRLSTQKTGDRLDIATSLDEIRDESYDLLILDGGLFSREFLESLNDKVIYAHSIFITTRESGETGLFEKLLYKPFLPTELLFMLHQVASSVQKEQEELSKEIVFDDFENSFFSDDEIASGEDEIEQDALERVQQFEKIAEESLREITADEASEEEVLENIFSKEDVSEVRAIDEIVSGEDSLEQDALERVQQFEKIAEESLQEVTADEASEEEVLENIFSKEDVSEVKAILDELNSGTAAEEEEIVETALQEGSIDDIDQELERALQNLSEDDLALGVDGDALMQLDDISTDALSWDEPKETQTPSKQNQESIETLRTLVKALENPQLARSLRGTITINLTFGED